MGAFKWGLKATSCNLRTIVYDCALLWPVWPLSYKGNFRHKMTTIVGNRGQLWTSILSPHLDVPERYDRQGALVIQIAAISLASDSAILRWPGDSQRESERFA